jgi:hypothetical protein
MRKTALALALAAATSAATAQTPPAAPAAPRPGAPTAAPTPPAASPAPSSSAAPSASPSPGAGAQPRKDPVERGTVLEEVSGKVAEIDRRAHRLSVETASGPVTLSLDRNTMVYTATGLGTVLDLSPGVQVRAGRNAEFLAYWVQVRTPAAPAASTPGQGTGPAGGGSAPASEGSGPGAPTAPPTTGAGPGAGPGGAPPGR